MTLKELRGTHLFREEGTTPLGTRKAVLVSKPPLFMTVRLAGGVGILEVELVEEEEEEDGGWLAVVITVVKEEVTVEVAVEVMVAVVLLGRDAGGVPPSLSLTSLSSAVPCC